MSRREVARATLGGVKNAALDRVMRRVGGARRCRSGGPVAHAGLLGAMFALLSVSRPAQAQIGVSPFEPPQVPRPRLEEDETARRVLGGAFVGIDLGIGLWSLGAVAWGNSSEGHSLPGVAIGDGRAIALGIGGAALGAGLGAWLTDTPKQFNANAIATSIGLMAGAATGLTGLVVNLVGCDEKSGPVYHECGAHGSRFLMGSIATGSLAGATAAVTAMLILAKHHSPPGSSRNVWVGPGSVMVVF